MSLTLTRRGEFWEDEKERYSGKSDTEEAKWEHYTKERYQATWLNIDKNHGLI